MTHGRHESRRLLGILLALLLPPALDGACTPEATNQEVTAMTQTRPSVLAGTWYDRDPQRLANSVDAHIAKGRTLAEVAASLPLAVIAPHAGHQWSGDAAGHVYRLFAGEAGRRIQRVILIGPSHRYGFRGASVPAYDAYQTPLGKIPVDGEVVAALRKSPLFDTVAAAHSQEHCLEIQLPFLQRVLEHDFRIVPILVSRLAPADWGRAAEALVPFVDEHTLVLASSDFTHFGAHFGYYPFRENVDVNLRRLDKGALAPILRLDPQAFAAYESETQISVCGFQAIGIVLELLRAPTLQARWGGSPEGRVLEYYRSADLTGELDGSVSYAAVAFFPPGTLRGDAAYPPALEAVTPWGSPEPNRSAEPSTDCSPVAERSDSLVLNRAERDYLLALARRTVHELVTSHRIPQPEDYPQGVSAQKLQTPCGVFVTLEKNGRLRGCIGSIVGTRPLVEGVIENAVSAATHDPRFAPVSADELANLSIEISVLTPLRRASGPEEIVIGRHGVVLAQGGRRAVFLPQVAPAQNWDRETMLEHLAVKAGLPRDAWRDGATTFDLFEATVFAEGEEGTH